MVPYDRLRGLVRPSGQMVLLDKLLPRLRAEGKRVLLFSQFKIMLDLLEEYCALRQRPAERLDGSTSGPARQAAIDRGEQFEDIQPLVESGGAVSVLFRRVVHE